MLAEGDPMNRLFTNTIQTDGILCKHARGISERSGKEFHIFHEIIYFLGGDAEFISEDLHIQMKPETLIFIPKETYHQMVIHGDQQQYYRCLLQFAAETIPVTYSLAEHAGIKAIAADEEIKYLFSKLMSACDTPDSSYAVLVNAVLMLLLCALPHKKELTGKENFQTDLIRQATDYINRNIYKQLLLADIAAACNVSLSTLCHVFKKEMNIPIHKFIVKKRLVNAYHKISSGESATSAAIDSGFQDYSGFYKQYKKMFGFSPSCGNSR